MSIAAIEWAMNQPARPSAAKFVLVAMANCVNGDTFIAWPSIAALVEATGQDRKTVMTNLSRLLKSGYIEDTGERKGRTGQIIVYRLKSTETGTVATGGNGPKESQISPLEQSQKRNSTESGTVPDFPPKSTVSPPKESQISPERVPNQGHGTVIGTVIGTGREPEKKTRGARANVDHDKPTDRVLGIRDLIAKGVDPGHARDWLLVRKAKRAPLTTTALAGVEREARKAGISLAEAVHTAAVNSWQGFNAAWVRPESQRQTGPPGRRRETTEEHNRRAMEQFLGETIDDGRTIDA